MHAKMIAFNVTLRNQCNSQHRGNNVMHAKMIAFNVTLRNQCNTQQTGTQRWLHLMLQFPNKPLRFSWETTNLHRVTTLWMHLMFIDNQGQSHISPASLLRYCLNTTAWCGQHTARHLHLSGLSHILVARFVDDLRRVGDGDAGDLQDAAGREFHGDVAINVGS